MGDKRKNLHALVVDCLTAGEGNRTFTRDFIGAGPRYIAGFIEHISKSVITTELIRGEEIINPSNPSEISQLLTRSPLLCLSAMTMDHVIARKIFQKWSNYHNNPNFHLSMIGGPITADHNFLNRIPFDIAVLGEGEPVLEFLFQNNKEIILNDYNLNRMPSLAILDKMPGVIYRELNEIHCTEESFPDTKSWFHNTSSFPEKIIAYPDFQSARIYVDCIRGCSNFRRTSFTLASKISCQADACNGCRQEPFTVQSRCPSNIPPGCGYCSTINTFGAPKSRDIDPIVNEIEHLLKLGAHRIVLGGPDFLDFHRDRLVKGNLIDPTAPEPNYYALETLIKRLLQIDAIHDCNAQLFIENIKASLCTDHALDILATIPNPIFSIGCETGSSIFANALGRPNSPKTTLDAVSRAIKNGIRIHVYFIHSLPGDTEIYAGETLDLIRQFADVGVDKITLYKYQELPGSPFFNINPKYTAFSKATLKSIDRIKKFVIRYNVDQKYKLIGRIVRVRVSEPNSQRKNDAIGWILEGGPKVSIKNARKLLGTFQNVIITQVLSDRLVEGEIKDI